MPLNEWGIYIPDDDHSIRERKKQEAIDLRVAVYGACFCDLCHVNPGDEYHEIVSRHRTLGNEQARMLSFEPPICSLLCDYCHKKIAPTIAGREKLLVFNIRLYGYIVVRDALYAIPVHLRNDIRLPAHE